MNESMHVCMYAWFGGWVGANMMASPQVSMTKAFNCSFVATLTGPWQCKMDGCKHGCMDGWSGCMDGWAHVCLHAWWEGAWVV